MAACSTTSSQRRGGALRDAQQRRARASCILFVFSIAAAAAAAAAAGEGHESLVANRVLDRLTPAAVDCSLTPAGAYTLLVDGAPYLTSAAVYVRAGGALHSTADGSLSLAAPPTAPAPGSDALGAFVRQEVSWRAAAAPGLDFRTAVQVYAALGLVVFEQSWPSGASGTAAPGGDADQLASAWPSFALADDAPGRAAVSFGGRFLEASRAAPWADIVRGDAPSLGQHGGPIVLFDTALGNASASVAVLSLTQHALMVSAVDSGAGAAPPALSYGVLGSVTSIPAGFVARTLLGATRGGPTGAMLAVGRRALQYHGTTTRPPDMTTTSLGYGTDNGAYYYYQTEKNKTSGKPMTYEQTLLDVAADAKARGIPYKYMQLDSWWYPQGKGGGVTQWEAKPEVFPHGLEWLHEQLGMPFYMHNRMWAAENVYGVYPRQTPPTAHHPPPPPTDSSPSVIP